MRNTVKPLCIPGVCCSKVLISTGLSVPIPSYSLFNVKQELLDRICKISLFFVCWQFFLMVCVPPAKKGLELLVYANLIQFVHVVSEALVCGYLYHTQGITNGVWKSFIGSYILAFLSANKNNYLINQCLVDRMSET